MPQICTLPLGALETNCYLVFREGSGQCLVIDPGAAPETILDALDRLGLRPAAILLTHGQFDHVGGVRSLAAETDCPVYLHPADLALPPMLTAGPLYCTHAFADGDALSLAGLSVRVLHTPGHTPGSVCLLVENDLFTGDTLFAGSCGRTDFPGSSPADMRRSLARLNGLEGDFPVYPGHGPATTLSAQRQENLYLRGVL